MKGRILQIVTATSTVLFVGAVVTALLGRGGPIWIWEHGHRLISPQHGTLWIEWRDPLPDVPLPAPPSHFLVNRRFLKIHYLITDDYVVTPTQGLHTIYTDLYIDLWWLCLPFAPLPAIWLIEFARLRRRCEKGLCPTCGYDLRATPDRCPECGALPQN